MALMTVRDFVKELQTYPESRVIKVRIDDLNDEDCCAIAFIESPIDITMKGLQQTNEGDKDIIRIVLKGEVAE